MIVMALFDYESTNPDDLPFSKVRVKSTLAERPETVLTFIPSVFDW